MMTPEPGAHFAPENRPISGRDKAPYLEQAFGGSTLVALRATVAAHGDRLGAAGPKLDDLLLIAHELATNAIQHGGGRGVLRLWRDGKVAYCSVRDWGGGFNAGDAGRQAPAPGAARGRGLWLVRQLADQVAISTGETGTTITATLLV